jgi:large subunit ribosomal protein L29
MKKQELRELTRGELEQRLHELQDERFNLVMRRSIKALDNPLRLRTIRREAAQINTMLREDELGIRKLAQSKTSILQAMDAGKTDTK